MATPSYVPSLDGLRAIAALLIVLYHSDWLPYGWFGVPIFFVLSGFLITRILLSQRQRSASHFFGDFYRRRSLRIFPLYFAFVAGVALINYVVPIEHFDDRLPSLLTYTFNWSRATGAPGHEVYDPLWSLAVEEQFYFVWPLLVWFLRGRAFKLAIAGLIILTPLLRYGTALVLSTLDLPGPRWVGFGVYYVTTSHLDALAWGAALALIERERPSLLRRGWLPALVSGVILLVAGPDYKEPGPIWPVWGFSFLAIGSAGLIGGLVARGSRLLESPPLRLAGRLSYGVYILHYGLWILLRPIMGEPYTLYGAFCLVLFVLIVHLGAYTTWWFIERPFLRLKRSLKTQQSAVASPARHS